VSHERATAHDSAPDDFDAHDIVLNFIVPAIVAM
jgi:hypothetical protein